MRRAVLVGSALALAVGLAVWGARRPASDPAPGGLDRAWASVVASPEDPAGWVRLGEVQVEMDDLVSAEHAFRTALTLGDDSGLGYARLGFLLYGQGKDREARALLLEAKRRGADVPMLDFTLAALEPGPARAPVERGPEPTPSVPPPPAAASAARPPVVDAGVPGLDAAVLTPPPASPPPASPPAAPPPPRAAQTRAPEPPPPVEGPCVAPLSRHGRGVFLIDVAARGEPGQLVLDTGASITVLTEAFALDAGLALDHQRVVHAITANGQVQMPTAVVPRIEVGPHAAEGVRVAVCADCVEGIADGLLGLDLQATFHMELDLSRSEVRFGACE